MRTLVIIAVITIVIIVAVIVASVGNSTPRKKDVSRFLPGNNIDVDMAMKLVLHEPARFLHPPEKMPQLLINVPSAETLRELSG
jgi:hypothetical protein